MATKTPTKEIAKKTPQQFTGVVVSNKMMKTVVVEVNRLVKHPKYEKYYRMTRRIKAHDEKGTAIGATVMIEGCRPISKDKHFRVI